MRHKRAFTLIELLVVVAIIALLISILLPSLSRAREASKRVVCAQNLKGVSTASKTYAHDHNGIWPTVAHWPDDPPPDPDNLEAMGGTTGLPRDQESRVANEVPMYEQVSPTRAMWLLVRQRQINARSFICPSSSEDTVEEDEDVYSYYDFKGYGYMSYGYQISTMLRSNSATPRENRDPRMVFLADKNPGVTRSTETLAVESNVEPPPVIQGYVSEVTDNFIPMKNQLNDPPYSDPPWNGFLDIDMAPELFLKFNSPNHGGRGEGEGQNVSRADGSSEFFKSPLAGVDSDNIYSSQHNIPVTPWSLERNVYTGYWPGRSTASTTPGYLCLPSTSGGSDRNGTTDTMVFP